MGQEERQKREHWLPWAQVNLFSFLKDKGDGTKGTSPQREDGDFSVIAPQKLATVHEQSSVRHLLALLSDSVHRTIVGKKIRVCPMKGWNSKSE